MVPSIQGGLRKKRLNELIEGAENIEGMRQTIARRDTSYRKPAWQLYEALIKPIKPHLKTAQVDTLMLYLVDALRYLPFAALYDAADDKHLVEQYSLSIYTPAAQANLKDQSIPKWSAANGS